MLQSKLFTKTRREAPKDETSKNAKILIRAGFISKEMAGVYDFLPLGLKTLNKIIGIIREEMDAIGGEEIVLSALQEKEVWEASGRWDDETLDVWFKTKFKNETETGLATTHEEPLTRLMKEHIRSHKDLPVLAYQFQTKFRNELRSKGGLLRTKEFLMKDLYSFCKNKEEHERVYESLKKAYIKIFERVGIGHCTYLTFASGGSFSQFSHEFQSITSSGEDMVFLDSKKRVAVNKEVMTDDVLNDLGLEKKKLTEEKAIEVGNIFSLGTKFSDALGLMYSDEEDNKKPVIMGSYGIGPARVLGTVVEVLGDEDKMTWPYAISPFNVHLIEIPGEGTSDVAQKLYEKFISSGMDVLYDDRDIRAGEKFAEADLIGIPVRIIISEKSLASGGVEWIDRISGTEKVCSLDDAFDKTEKVRK